MRLSNEEINGLYESCLIPASFAKALREAYAREDEYMSIFRRCRDIIAFHSDDDSEKVEAMRRTLLQAPHIKQEQEA